MQTEFGNSLLHSPGSVQYSVMTTLLFLLMCFAGFSKAELPLPSYIEPCSRSDPDFQRCALEHARNVVPQIAYTGDMKYGVPVLEPLEVTEIRIDQGVSQVGLTLIIKECKLYGIKDLQIKNTSFDFQKERIFAELEIPRLYILGKYDASGRILLLPIYGKGDINVTFLNLVAWVTVDYKKVTKEDGKQYLSTRKAQGTLEVARMYLKANNLFNGDKFLGHQMNIILNDNWREVFQSLKPSVNKVLVTIIDNILNGFIGKVPFDVAFPT